MRSGILAFSMTLVLFGAGACGGNVIVESTGGAGTGGAGGGDIAAVCTKLCNAMDASGCQPSDPSCVESCATGIESIPSACTDEYVAALDCIAGEIPQSGCEPFEGCPTELAVLSECLTAQSCSGIECVGADTSCSCKGQCAGEARAVECALSNGEYFCTCYGPSGQVGTCNEPVEEAGFCDLEFGCCSAFF